MTAESVLKARSFRWGVNTVASFCVNLGVTIGLHEGLSVSPEASYAIALLTVFLMNFVFFRYYVFVQEKPLPLPRQFVAYTGSAIGFRLSEYLIFLLLHTIAGIHYVVAIVLVQGISFVVKFFFYGKFIFRDRGSA